MIPYIGVLPTGQIVSYGHVEQEADATPPIGASAVFGITASPMTQYFDWDKQELLNMPTRSSEEQVFNYKTKQWHDPRTVEQKESDRINKVKAARAAEYPNIGDQLDALWKAIASNPKGLPIETTDMLAVIQAVKAKHPK